MNGSDYAIISPVHNESAFLPRVIESIRTQSHQPALWVVVDDRSTDNTWSILQTAVRRLPYLKPVKVTGAAGRQVGSNIVRLFNTGYMHLPSDTPFVVNMDADILLPSHYFSTLLARFASDQRLGMASGKTYIKRKGRWVLERSTDVSVIGACKAYRHDCLKDIGGLLPMNGWDTLDGVKARMMGWHTRSFRDLPIRHLRPVGSAKGVHRTNLDIGSDCYGMRADPLFVLAKAIYRSLQRPYLSGLLIFAGYLLCCLRGGPRLDDRRLVRFLRREQRHYLIGRNLDQIQLFPRVLPNAPRAGNASDRRAAVDRKG